MTASQRAEMIGGMVERLAARLKQNGDDVDGWLRLVRAYMVLGSDRTRRSRPSPMRGRRTAAIRSGCAR